MNQLFSDDESCDDKKDVQLTINEHYAKAFEYRKEREELERLKQTYGSDVDESDVTETDSESDESEDEFAEELTPAVDAAILRTLAKIRNKDPSIYNSEKNVFGEERQRVERKAPLLATASSREPRDKSKPVTLRQAKLDSMLNEGSDEEDKDQPRPMTHVEEQEALRRETITAFHAAADQADDDFLVEREKTQDELEKEQEEFKQFLQREVGDLRDLLSVDGDSDKEKEKEGDEDLDAEEGGKQEAEGKDKKRKKKKKKKTEVDGVEKRSKAETDQEFLMNYILNRGWIDRSSRHVPTYSEVTASSSKKPSKKKSKTKVSDGADENHETQAAQDEEEDAGLLSDSSFDSLVDVFEASYNHRFEEPDAAIIPSYPRNIASTVRRQDTVRKEARERRKERKEEEIRKKREEIGRLKALKLKEIKRKLAKIGKQGGLRGAGDGGDEFVDEALKELDLEGEWDPEKHDRQMSGLFDRDGSAFEDDQGGYDDFEVDARYDEEGKPVWDDDIDIGDIEPKVQSLTRQQQKKERKKKKKKKGLEEDDEAAVDIDDMDADVVPEDDEEWDGTEEMRKRKLDEYMDDLYKLEFNDVVGDLPTRFKYVPVQSQNYNLSPVEILLASDKELNEFMSVKKYAPYRQDPNDWKYKKQNREKLKDFKTKVAERAKSSSWHDYVHQSGSHRREGVRSGEQGREVKKKRMGKKERMRLKGLPGAKEGSGDVEMNEGHVEENDDAGQELKKRKYSEQDAVPADAPMEAEAESSRRKKKRRH